MPQNHLAKLLLTDEELVKLGECVQAMINEGGRERSDFGLLNSLRTALSEARYDLLPTDE